MSETLTIELQDLRFFSYHGWHEEEAKTGNAFEVCVSIDVRIETDIHSIEQTVNYVKAYEVLKEEMALREKLLETLLMRIANRFEKEFPAMRKLSLSIKKLTAPIPNFTGSVGVKYTKEW